MTRALIGNLLVGLALLALGGALLTLHGGDWWLAAPLPRQWWIAGASLLAYAGFCTWIGWRPRPPARGSTDATALLVAWASQTGLARELAERSASAFVDAGQPAIALPLEQLDGARLADARRLLVVASTTGEGDPPDHALPFLRNAMRQDIALPALQYGVLALGDHSYGNFCAFGRQLDEWLRHRGAQPLFDRVEVDNAAPDALRHWQHLISHIGGQALSMPDWERPSYRRWRLDQRTQVNPGSVGGAVYRLALTPLDGPLPDWTAGDIAEVGPRNGTRAVAEWLQAHRLDALAVVEGRTLQDWLADSQLGGIDASGDLHEWVRALKPLPHREYSIASIPAEGRLQLLLRLHENGDGSLGLGSGWLCRHAAPAAEIALRIRHNPGFHPPAPDAPMILIGNGTGIAGLRAHLRARIEAGARRNWLLFGERNAACDFHYRDELLQWRQQGWIERLDTVFSRDGHDGPRYVQHALREAGDALRRWIDEGAAIYVCGSLRGMAPEVDRVLEQALGPDLKEDLLLQGRYRRDVY